jgi:hypothetical protein
VCIRRPPPAAGKPQAPAGSDIYSLVISIADAVVVGQLVLTIVLLFNVRVGARYGSLRVLAPV